MAFLCPLKLVDPAKLFSINCNNKSFFWEFSLCLYNALLSLLVFPLEYFLLNEMQWYIFFLAVFLLTECIFCTYKSPAVLILTTKKRILKEQGKKYWGWNWELGKSCFLPLAFFDGLLCALLDFEGIKINQSMSTRRWVECSRLIGKLTDTWTKRMGIPKRLEVWDKSHFTWLESGRMKGIHF